MPEASGSLHAFLDVVPDVIITTDEDGLILSFSQAAEKLFGYSADEIIGRNVKILMPQPYRDEHDGYMERYRATGERRIIGIGREVEAQKKDGTIFPVSLAVGEMVVDGARMFTGVVHDITELRLSRAFGNRLGEIIDRSLNEIYLFDADTLYFTQVNYGARRNLGYSNREFRKLTPADIKPEFTPETFADLIQPLRDGQKDLLVFNSVHQRKDGSTYPVEVHLQLMKEESPPVFLAIIQDTTEIMRREEETRQSQKMEAIGQLTGGIAHDFNNLLTIIIGNTELLEGMIGGDGLQASLLDEARTAAENAAKLTGQLLAFARKQPLDPKIIDLNDMVADMEEMLRRSLDPEIRLRTIKAKKLRMTRADPGQVHNALLNLAINARDAMPDGGELIIETSNADLDEDEAATRTDAEPGRYVRLSVRDTGVGMPPDVRKRVLEPFFTTKELGRGTGLGLSMVHGFAKQSGGFLEVYSEEGYGTAISFYLPEADGEVDLQKSDAEPRQQPVAPHETVLVVEDDERVRAITVRRLQHLGYKVLEAQTGQQALNKLKTNPDIDVVFTDMVMPGGMNGGDLLREAQRKYPNVKRLITSGYAEDGTIPNDGTRWLRKPYSLDEMAETFRELLDGQPAPGKR